MRIKTYKLLILALLLVAPNAYPKDHNVISLASAEWPKFTNSDGTGLFFDIIRAVYRAGEVGMEFEIVPYERSVKMVEDKLVDAWVASYIEEEDFPLYPKWHFGADIVIAVFDPDKFPEWEGEKSLSGKTVAWLRGYNYDEYLNVRVEIDEINKRRNGLRMLQRGRIDVLLDAYSDMIEEDNVTIKGTSLRFKEGFNEFTFAAKEILQLRLYLAFADTDRARKFMEIWDRNFPILLEKGVIKRLFKKYSIYYPFAS